MRRAVAAITKCVAATVFAGAVLLTVIRTTPCVIILFHASTPTIEAVGAGIAKIVLRAGAGVVAIAIGRVGTSVRARIVWRRWRRIRRCWRLETVIARATIIAVEAEGADSVFGPDATVVAIAIGRVDAILSANPFGAL